MPDHGNGLTTRRVIDRTIPRSMARLYWLALGTFAISTEGFMIAPLLADLARDLSVSVADAGQLVTVFALTHALTSPVLTALTGDVDRRRLLTISMPAFAAANFVAWSAQGFLGLLAARILLAVAAGLYVPNASALASAVADPAQRGTALSIVTGGSSLAVALGAPLGALVGDRFGWRLKYLHRVVPRACREVEGSAVSMVLFVWGVAAVIGLRLGGRLNDRYGHLPVIVTSLSVLALAFLSLSMGAAFLPPPGARAPIVLAIAVWGVSAWAFFPAQQARLISIAGVKVAPVARSLNASFQFLGFSAGGALGSLTLDPRLTPGARLGRRELRGRGIVAHGTHDRAPAVPLPGRALA
jgi:DHA1 family purine base/nucleoside efflux pump-like MFS transporter